MNVLFDTNVLVDVFQKNEFCLYSFAAYDVCILRGYRPCLAVSTIPDLEYLFRHRTEHTKAEARDMLGRVFELFDIIDMAECDCILAHKSPMPDYEYAMIAYAAQRTGTDLIVTRDLKDFEGSPVPYMTPQEFVESFKPDDITYAEMPLAEKGSCSTT